MIFPKQNGRLQLFERMRQLLPAGQSFTLAHAIDVFQESFASDRIEDTSDGLILAAWPIGRIGKRYIDIALCRPLGWDDEEWDEPPGFIMAHLKVPCGLRSMFLSKQLYEMESVERAQATSFFESIRNTRMYRWYAVRKPIESKVTLSASHEFFDMAAKILPKLKEARLLNCDD